jgi:hypothetical protein
MSLLLVLENLFGAKYFFKKKTILFYVEIVLSLLGKKN